MKIFFVGVLHAWSLDEIMFLCNKYKADLKAHRLEISGPSLRFAVIYMRPVRTQSGTRISHLGLATETKSD